MLHTATMHTLRATATLTDDDDDDDDTTAVVESHDVLMEAWVSLLLGTGPHSHRRRPPAVDEAAAALYDASVRAKLHAAAAAAAREAEEEVGDGVEDADTEAERMASLAVLVVILVFTVTFTCGWRRQRVDGGGERPVIPPDDRWADHLPPYPLPRGGANSDAAGEASGTSMYCCCGA